MTIAQIKQRLDSLENQMMALRARIDRPHNDWKRFVGMFSNDPYFERAMRYGREYRESLRPKPVKRRARRK